MSFEQRGYAAARPSSPAQVRPQPARPQLAPQPAPQPAAQPAPQPSAALPTRFDQLGLTPDLLATVAAQGYTEPTPVQAQSIPIVLAGRDLLASAQTGTGKTAAFVLPILQLLNANRPPVRYLPGGKVKRGYTGLPIRCLVLTPTRELALQIEESFRTYGAANPIKSTTIYGGVGFEPQVRTLRTGPEIVVATPGRLLDHAGQGTIDLRSVEILVLDEADRMLDMGFIRDIRRIIELMPAVRQNLLFSATFSDEIRTLASGFLRNPAQVQVARRNAPIELVRQVVYPVDRDRKRELLSHLVRSGRIDRALVFARTKHGANRLADQLIADGILAAAIHGNKSQGQRVRALDDFKAGRAAILVATEIAARGLDIDGLPHVVNFELPMVAQDYVHRIGRTGRAGMEGDAVSLVCIDENSLLSEIEILLRDRIRREVVPGFEVDRSIARQPILQRSAGGGGRPMSPRMGQPRRAAPEAPRQAPSGDVGRPFLGGVAPARRPGQYDAQTRPAVPARSAAPGRPEYPARPAAPARHDSAARPSAPAQRPYAPAGRGSSGRPAASPARPGTSIGYRPAPVGNRQAPAGARPPDRRAPHSTLPGERIQRSGGRSS